MGETQSGMHKNGKKSLSIIIDDVHKIAKTRILSQQEIDLKNQPKIARLTREEQIKWYQRSKADFHLGGRQRYTILSNGREWSA